MNKKELIKIINNFVKLNPKKEIYPKINRYDSKVFFDVQNLFKNNLKLINQNNYNLIFSSKDGKFLSGKKWIEILFTSKNIDDYHTNLRRYFQICNQKLLFENISDDLFFIYYHDQKIVIIEASEINFDNNTKKELEKIRYFLDKQDWSIYFFEIQKLMHKQIIKFLDWKGNFTYDNYSKVLSKKLKELLTKQQVEQYLLFVQKVNLYRNTFAKAKAAESDVNQELLKQWNDWTILIKKTEVWDLYHQLNNFINVINLIIQEKY